MVPRGHGLQRRNRTLTTIVTNNGVQYGMTQTIPGAN